MTPSSLPTKLYRALGEVKQYVEKLPDGATLSDIQNKVHHYHELNKKNGNS